MKSSLGFSAAALSALLALASALPVQAGPIENIPLPKYSDVEKVQYRPYRRDHDWHGYRGYDHGRPGYRRHSDGYWYPLAAFAAGALITGAIVNSNRSSNHVAWCENRYRSYRASDDSFQPNYGPRQRCVSP